MRNKSFYNKASQKAHNIMSLRCRNITQEVTNQETRRIAKNKNNKNGSQTTNLKNPA